MAAIIGIPSAFWSSAQIREWCAVLNWRYPAAKVPWHRSTASLHFQTARCFNPPSIKENALTHSSFAAHVYLSLDLSQHLCVDGCHPPDPIRHAIFGPSHGPPTSHHERITLRKTQGSHETLRPRRILDAAEPFPQRKTSMLPFSRKNSSDGIHCTS
jgi:hypothetical protein